jgi:type II secretory pathway pseudopilin PulG
MTTTSTRTAGTKGRKERGTAATSARRRPAPAPDDAPKTAPKSAPKSKPVPKSRPAPKTKAAPKTAPKTKATPKNEARPRTRQAAVRHGAPPRAPFVLLIVGLLSGALMTLLLLNTVLAQDAFTLTRLQQSNKLLDQQRQQLQRDNARESSPENLAQRAKALGMQPQEPLYIDRLTGQIVGPGSPRAVPSSAAAAAAAAAVAAIPGAAVPGGGVPTAPGGDAVQPGARPGSPQTPTQGGGAP